MPATARMNIRPRPCSISTRFASAEERSPGFTSPSLATFFFSRVARSNIFGLLKLGARVTLVGPSTLVPREFEKLGVAVSHDIDGVLPTADVVNLLRIQHERQRKEYFPGVGEYIRLFGLTKERARLLKPDCLIMHPGPINRGVEIDSEVADGAQSVILDQVTNGLAVRMAVLYLVWRDRGDERQSSETVGSSIPQIRGTRLVTFTLLMDKSSSPISEFEVRQSAWKRLMRQD